MSDLMRYRRGLDEMKILNLKAISDHPSAYQATINKIDQDQFAFYIDRINTLGPALLTRGSSLRVESERICEYTATKFRSRFGLREFPSVKFPKSTCDVDNPVS